MAPSLRPGEDLDFTICADGSIRPALIAFPPSEDAAEWERFADSALAEAGWERVAEWGATGTLVAPSRL